MELDVVLLSRLQFAFTVMFHYLYPPLSIGLGLLIVIMEGMFLRTGNPIYERMTKFWIKIFALTFGLGVASGIVMEFEFGTNWATYSRYVGDVFGSALAAEGIFAFFLESGFLAILVFGWDRVSPKMHFFSAIMVFLGSLFSSVWIVVANSWMQTPAGYHIVGEGLMARAEIVDFWALVFNPSSMVRLTHVVLGCFIQGAFLVLSISAWYLLKNRHLEFARRSFTIALVVATLTSLAQLIAGHFSAEVVAKYQPAKLAAFEGVYKTEESTPLYLFGFPNSETETVDFGVAVPGGLSFLVHKDFTTPVTGLDQFAKEDRPPVALPFQMYHIMIALGMYFIGLTCVSLLLLWTGKLFQLRWLMWVFVFSVVGPFIANQAGWIAAEVGRQPWIVYGLLRTSDGVSKAVAAEAVLASLIMFTFLYALLFLLFIYLLDRKIKHGPDEEERDLDVTPHYDFIDAISKRKSASSMMDSDSLNVQSKIENAKGA
jgi:cytochrome d ubiquinol oxidase subunit I